MSLRFILSCLVMAMLCLESGCFGEKQTARSKTAAQSRTAESIPAKKELPGERSDSKFVETNTPPIGAAGDSPSRFDAEAMKEVLEPLGARFSLGSISDESLASIDFEDGAVNDKGEIKPEIRRELEKTKGLGLRYAFHDTTNKWTDETLKELSDYSSITQVTCQNVDLVTDGGIDFLLKMVGLKALQFTCGGKGMATDAGLAKLSQLKQLESLFVTSEFQTDGSFLTSFNGHGLKRLSLSGEEFTDEGLAELTELPQLKEFSFDFSKIKGTGLRFLSSSPNLESVRIVGCDQLSDAAIDHLKSLPLQTLQIAAHKGETWAITDRSLEVMGTLTKLERLQIHGPAAFSDSALSHLVRLKSLAELQLDECPSVTDESLLHISKIENLERLSMNGTKISDSGLELLVPLKKLIVIEAKKTGVTKAGADRLKEKMPGLKSVITD